MCTPAARTSPARHIFFSIFLVHPQHPYGKLERFFLLLCTVLFGFGLSALIVVALLYAENAAPGLSGNSTDPVYADAYARYEEFKDSGNRWTVLLCSTVLVQALYDNFAKVLFICSPCRPPDLFIILVLPMFPEVYCWTPAGAAQ